jgi:hypothetical protein
MKKILMITLLLVLSGCGVFERGNYDVNRDGYVLSGDFIVKYHTNSVGEIDVFMIDEVLSYFEALDYTSFDFSRLGQEDILNNTVTEAELLSCGISQVTQIPRFIRIDDQTYYYNVRDNGTCTYDEYEFHSQGYTILEDYDIETVSPLENINKTIFKDADFHINTFETIVYIEEISYNVARDEWEKEIVTVLPMSLRQAGNIIEDNTDYFEEISVIEYYVLENQSVNLLELREDYEDENVNNIWSDDTVDRLGRDHEVIKTVRTKKTGDILDIITDTLARLGMFS